MPLRSVSLLCRPDSESEISRIADYLLRKAGVAGKLPTPIEDLIALAGVKDVPDSEAFKEQFLASLPQKARAVFGSAWQKIRGIADLRERAVYVPKTTTAPRLLFAKAHELGHQVISWHKLNRAYLDDKRSLTPAAEHLFDIEANFFAAEVIFQGQRFANRVRDYQPSFDAVSLLADEHGASKHATLHRYVEEHDETIAAIPYWPSFYTADENGYPILRAGKVIGSPRFVQKYAGIQLPLEIRTGHEWAAARDAWQVCAGNVRLDCGAGPVNFQWQSWWNKYTLFVLLRRKPAFSLVGQIIR